MNAGTTKCSLLISTYNWPEALDLCLQSVLYQTVPPAEIIIADDGSGEKTKALIDSYREMTSIPIKHVWHEDDGFRKTFILNEAIRVSECGYIIETDGDIILHPQFIEEHMEVMAEGMFVRGSRAMIKKETTQKLLQQRSTGVNFFTKGLMNRMNSLRSPILSYLHFIVKRENISEGLLGCNFSFWKKDFIDVNGYNNDIVGWGHEDSELAVRLINNGVKRRTLKYKAICFHLHHTIFARNREKHNTDMRQAAIDNKLTVCKNGYNTHQPVTVWRG